MTNTTLERLARVAKPRGLFINEELTLPGREPVFSPLPAALPQQLDEVLRKQYPAGLYRHQAEGIELGLAGENVCMATATASGKTLVFASIVLTKLLRSAGGTALVLYPAKALLADQARKWAEIAEICDLDVVAIDGGVHVNARPEMLDHADIVLMTPDILHAWLLGRCDLPETSNFLRHLRLLVLDEAHVYEGVFGTNMSYLMRRLRAASTVRQFIASTATISDAAGFLNQLTGVEFSVVGPSSDGSKTYPKTFVHLPLPQRQLHPFMRDLVLELSTDAAPDEKFIAFVDSRKTVEELVSLVLHHGRPAGENEGCGDGDGQVDAPIDSPVLPYRAGYEEADRAAIQTALTQGSLVGVISTSALELGIDIGAISTVVLAGVPATSKSFLQRAGRAGRSGPGSVILIDADQTIPPGGLQKLLARPPEENWTYLNNEYLQFANALCAADESASLKDYSDAPYEDLPPTFMGMLRNERTPTQPLSQELYPLKQQANTMKPHFAFPVRTGMEKQYKVYSTFTATPLGTLGYSQVLREAFPGAIYRYMARAFRVTELQHGKGEIRTKPLGGIGRTTPRSQAMAFPMYPMGVLALLKSDSAFVMETKMQVSERVTGFVETWGQKKTEHKYEAGSPYAQKPLARFFDTTGVVLYFHEVEYGKDACAQYLTKAFCRVCGIQEREIGHGAFTAKLSPLGDQPVSGIAVYDSVQGSLRLTRQFARRVDEIFQEAHQLATTENSMTVAGQLLKLRSIAASCQPAVTNQPVSSIEVALDEWMDVIAEGQQGVLHDGDAHVNEEVTVQRFVYTREGPMYILVPPTPGSLWRVSANMVRPMPGTSGTYKYNVQTGEEIRPQ